MQALKQATKQVRTNLTARNNSKIVQMSTITERWSKNSFVTDQTIKLNFTHGMKISLLLQKVKEIKR